MAACSWHTTTVLPHEGYAIRAAKTALTVARSR